jgi:NADH dehydrogenase/NADH:ubiquinone oxidoreductase subunit G
VPDERIPLEVGLKVTQIVQETSPVRGMYIMGENPILSDPEVSHAEHWFRNLEFLAVQDLFLTETARYADVVFPGASFAEKTGTFVNTERRIQLSHKAIDPPGNARGDLEIIIDLSNRIGLPTPFTNSAEVMTKLRGSRPRGRECRTLAWRGTAACSIRCRTPITRERISCSTTCSPRGTARRPSSASNSCRRRSCLTTSTRSC